MPTSEPGLGAGTRDLPRNGTWPAAAAQRSPVDGPGSRDGDNRTMPDSAEIELKFETDPSFTLPDLTDVPGVAAVRRRRSGCSRRRTSTPPTSGWPRTGTRCAGAPAATTPAGTSSGPARTASATRSRSRWATPTWSRRRCAGSSRCSRAGRRLAPVVVIRTRRNATVLLDDQERVLLELADDAVTATVLASDGPGRRGRGGDGDAAGTSSRRSSSRATAALLDAVEARLLGAGARVSSSPSKLARALGEPHPGAGEPGAPGSAARPRRSSAYLRDQVGGPAGAGPAGAGGRPGRGAPDAGRLPAAARAARRLPRRPGRRPRRAAARGAALARRGARGRPGRRGGPRPAAGRGRGAAARARARTGASAASSRPSPARYREAHDRALEEMGGRALLRPAGRPRRARDHPAARPRRAGAGERGLPAPAGQDLPADGAARRGRAGRGGRSRPARTSCTRSASRPSGRVTPPRRPEDPRRRGAAATGRR